MKLTNRWNRLVYRMWSPIYDRIFDRLFAGGGRRRAMALLDVQPGHKVLLVGVGTGADLPLLPQGVTALGLDLSPDMLARARAKPAGDRVRVSLVRGDAQRLPVMRGGFDAAVLNLVLSVVPDGAACLSETVRAVRPGGRIVIFDKFQPDGARLTAGRRLLNQVTTLFGTDITRRLADILSGTGCTVLVDEPGLLRGAYRVILLEAPERQAGPQRPRPKPSDLLEGE